MSEGSTSRTGRGGRADVSALCDTTGRPIERIKYSAYGTPITLTDIDYNSDGNLDPDDTGDFVNTPYDWNLDGSTNGSDITAFQAAYNAVSGNAYGRGYASLAGHGNRIGYAGYIYDRFISGSDGGKWQVRHRVLDSGLGRWTRRDPLGYVDGMGLYEYVNVNPVVGRDSSGLVCEIGGPTSCEDEPTLPLINCIRDNPRTRRMFERFRDRYRRGGCPGSTTSGVGMLGIACGKRGDSSNYNCATRTITVDCSGPDPCGDMAHELLHAADFCDHPAWCVLQSGGPRDHKVRACIEARAATLDCCADANQFDDEARGNEDLVKDCLQMRDPFKKCMCIRFKTYLDYHLRPDRPDGTSTRRNETQRREFKDSWDRCAFSCGKDIPPPPAIP